MEPDNALSHSPLSPTSTLLAPRFQYPPRENPGSHSRQHSVLNKHVPAPTKTCFFHIWALRHIRRALTDDSAKSIAGALVGSHLDYANAVLVGTSASNIYKLQRVQNTLARIVTRQHGLPGITQTLATLHWLPTKWRVKFKIVTTTYKLLSQAYGCMPLLMNLFYF